MSVETVVEKSVVRYTGALKSAKVISLPSYNGTLISVRMIAFEKDSEPILDQQGELTEQLVEFTVEAVGILLHKAVVCRANVSLTNPTRLRTLVFGKYPSHITVTGEPQADRSPLTLLNPTIVEVEDPSLPNDLPHIIKAELSIINKLAKPQAAS
jgi:hypothetical protein